MPFTTDSQPQFAPAAAPQDPVRFLDEAGVLLPGAEPRMDHNQALEALRLMMLGRAFDVKCWSLQRQGRLGTFAPINGQEATIVGAAMALDPARDWMIPQYRELPGMLHHGFPPELVVLYRQGHPDGGIVPAGVRVLQYQVSLAAQLPHAVGLAWGMQLQQQPGVALVYFGDGASSEGDFHESCNLAGSVGAPVIFVLQNNQWAISTPRSSQSAASNFAARAPGYGFPGVSVDGNDLLAMHKVTAEAVDRALAGQGPTLIEAQTYRMWAHTTADDPTRYVDPDELATWEGRDPIARLQGYLRACPGELWSDERASAWEAEIANEIAAIFERAAAHPPPDPAALYEHLFAEPTPALVRQRQWNLGD